MKKLRCIGIIILSTLLFVIITKAQTVVQSGEDASDAVAIFERAQNAHESGDLQTALKLYDEALKANGDFPEAEYQKATILIIEKKNSEAEKSLRRAMELRPDWSLPPAQLGTLLVKENRFDEADKVLTTAISLDANSFPAYLALVDLRLKQKSNAETLNKLLVQFKKLTDGKSGAFANVWVMRANLENALNDKKAAQASVNRALVIEPNNVAALTQRATTFLDEKKYDAARDDAKNILKTDPNDLPAKLILSESYAANDNTGEALEILNALDDSQKKLPAVVALRGKIVASTVDNPASFELLEKTLATDANNVAVLGQLCRIARTINPNKAIDYCRRALKIEPANVTFATGYGAALVRAKRYLEAANVLPQILAIAPDNYPARANYAVTLYELKRFPEAIKQYEQISVIKPDLAVTYYYLATAHDVLGEYESATENYQKFLSLADAQQNQLEISKVSFRLPILEKQIKKGQGKKPVK